MGNAHINIIQTHFHLSLTPKRNLHRGVWNTFPLADLKVIQKTVFIYIAWRQGTGTELVCVVSFFYQPRSVETKNKCAQVRSSVQTQTVLGVRYPLFCLIIFLHDRVPRIKINSMVCTCTALSLTVTQTNRANDTTGVFIKNELCIRWQTKSVSCVLNRFVFQILKLI